MGDDGSHRKAIIGEEAHGMATHHQNLNKVMVFCDGTWCGQLTGTETNVKILADTIAGKSVNSQEPFVSRRNEGIVGCYYDGEGVEGGFSDYLLDGALGGKIKQDCLLAYKFLMDEFEKTDGQCEAWLIGLSRGSYTVRCVAGMINNCGLISRKVIAKRLGHGHGQPTDSEIDDIVQRAYVYYRDRTLIYTPDTEYMKQWKRDHSRVTLRPPVKFMGLFETVGALGIPLLSPGTGVDYYGSLNFYGKADEGASAVSGEVERVYQALAVHDRLTAFSPCHVKRDKLDKEFSYNKERHLDITYVTKELWFPGAHYDIGRQKFMFYKSPALFTTDLKRMKLGALVTELSKRLVERGISLGVTRLLRIPDIYPNYEYSFAVLTWMAKKMAKTDPEAFGILRDLVMSAKAVEQESWTQKLFNLLTLKPTPLGNDAYDQLINKNYLTLELVPFAHRFLVALLSRYFLMDRTIADPPLATPPAPPVKFFRAAQLPGVDPDIELKASEAYRSRSFDSYNIENILQSTRLKV